VRGDHGGAIFAGRLTTLLQVNVGNYLNYNKYRAGDYNEFLVILSQISPAMYGKVLSLLQQPQEFFFEPIKSIKSAGKCKTYDLRMHYNGNPAFVSNAMLVHNSGDANYATADAAMSVFIEQMRAYRAMLTQEIFYQKIFPAIALANDFTKEQYQVIAKNKKQQLEAFFNGTEWVTNSGSERSPYSALCADVRHGLNVHGKHVKLEDLATPHIVWQKHLRPEGDQIYFELLAGMQDKGIPVPLATLAMAGGIDIQNVLNSMDEDIKIRKRVKQYMEKIQEFVPEQAEGGEEEQTQANVRALAAMASRFGVKKPVGLFNRTYDERLLPHERKKGGQYRSTTQEGRNRIYNRLNKVLAESMAKAAERENRRIKRERKENRKLIAHGRLGIIK